MTGLNQFYENDAVAFASIKTWTPAPLEIAVGVNGQRGAGRGAPRGNPNRPSSYRRPSGDTISLLTDIYGTKELFLSAYRSMLAEKLVHKIDFDCSNELKTLELLKIRFGEAALQNAEIMMRDVNDSKRLNAVIHGGKGGGGGGAPSDGDAMDDANGFFSSLRVLVTSDQYWPSISKDDTIDFSLPADVEAATRPVRQALPQPKGPAHPQVEEINRRGVSGSDPGGRDRRVQRVPPSRPRSCWLSRPGWSTPWPSSPNTSNSPSP